MNEACRLCLESEKQLSSVFDEKDGQHLAEIIKTHTTVEIDENDDYSKKICDQCLETITRAHKLRGASIRCDNFLKFQNTTVHVVQVIKNENGGLIVEAAQMLNECKTESVIEGPKEECFAVKEVQLEAFAIQEDVYREPKALIIQEPVKMKHSDFISTSTFAISTVFEARTTLLDSSDSDDDMMLSERILKQKSKKLQQKSCNNKRKSSIIELSVSDKDEQLLDFSVSDDDMMLSERILKQKSKKLKEKSFNNKKKSSTIDLSDEDVSLLDFSDSSDSSDEDDEIIVSDRILRQKPQKLQHKLFDKNKRKRDDAQAKKKARIQRKLDKLQAAENSKAIKMEMRKKNLEIKEQKQQLHENNKTLKDQEWLEGNWKSKTDENCRKSKRKSVNLPLRENNAKQRRTDIDGLFVCETCEKTFRRQEMLELHIEDFHNDEDQPFHCGSCKNQFESQAKLDKHNKLHIMDKNASTKFEHGEELKERMCSVCDKKVKSVYMLIDHFNRFHNRNKNPYACSLCGYLQRTEEAVVQHALKMHGNVSIQEFFEKNHKRTIFDHDDIILQEDELEAEDGLIIF